MKREIEESKSLDETVKKVKGEILIDLTEISDSPASSSKYTTTNNNNDEIEIQIVSHSIKPRPPPILQNEVELIHFKRNPIPAPNPFFFHQGHHIFHQGQHTDFNEYDSDSEEENEYPYPFHPNLLINFPFGNLASLISGHNPNPTQGPRPNPEQVISNNQKKANEAYEKSLGNSNTDPLPIPGNQASIKCAICLSHASDTTPLSSTICGHIFCQPCLDESLKSKKNCPTCRKSLKSKNSIHRLFLT